MIRMTYVRPLCALLVGVVGTAQAQDATAISGCYRFDRAYFSWVGRLPGRAEVISDSTRVLRLFARSTVHHVLVRGAVLDVEPIPFAVDSTTARRWLRPSNWTISNVRSHMFPHPTVIDVVWRNGLYGPVFRLSAIGDTLRGQVRFTTDVAGAEPPAQPAWAVRIPCPAG
jgi:hypothetical protein